MLFKCTSALLMGTLGLGLIGCNQNTPETQQQAVVEAPAPPVLKPADDAVTISLQPEADTLKGSPKARAAGKIGGVNLVVSYHSPAVRKRVVWGGLVPYDQVWVTGAHSATSIQTDGPLKIGGRELPAGKYALFTIPGEKEWTVILNRNWDQHLADEYAEKEDVVRIAVRPEKTPGHQERLRYEVVPGEGNAGQLVITWEQVRLAVPVSGA